MTEPHQPRVEVKILDPRLHDWGMPAYQSAQAAALDLHACLDAPLTLPTMSTPVLVSTGIALLMQEKEMAALILPRSGLGHRLGLVLGNLVGLIDPDYTGPVMVSAWNRGPPGSEPVVIRPGERFAQMLFVPVLHPTLVVVEEHSRATARGAGGFGSTGGHRG
ncbi:MAG TPA: dUTP diphosphatase [Acetobacteraceae bacterium]|nr:dUTP diphosphatase [Acetobacteraceae bacterium]